MKQLLLILSIVFISLTSVFSQYEYDRDKSLPCLDKNFSVVVHLVKDTMGNVNITEADVLTLIDTLNTYFEPICASFSVCEFRVIDNYQYSAPKNENEFQQMINVYNEENRINLYFSDLVSWSQDAAGFGTDEGVTMDRDGGIVAQIDYVTTFPKGLPHLFGHYFGLIDTWAGNGSEQVNGDDCEIDGDFICDTPSDPYIPGDTLIIYINPDICRFRYRSRKDENGEYYRTDVSNIMSYYPESCKCGFSHDQYVKMANTYRSSPYKLW